MAKRISLITDSTCDIPAQWWRQYQLTVIPMTIMFGEEQFLDGVDMSARDFYERLPNDSHHPTTSQPAPVIFLEAYRKLASEGAREIVAILISSAMSGTHASAVQAAADFDLSVHIIDSRSNSMGLGWQVIAAARARDSGGSIGDILAAAEGARQTMAYYVALDTMNTWRAAGASAARSNSWTLCLR